MSEPFLGQITLFPYSFPPNGWADCAGQLLPISQYSALFSLLGVTYGGNGQSNFQLPNLQGVVPVGQGSQPGGGAYVIGSTGGTENVTLITSTMPAHGHALNAVTTHGTLNSPSNMLLAVPQSGPPTDAIRGEIYNSAQPDCTLTPGSILPTGGSMPHNNLQPFLVLRYCIALQGVSPSRA